MPESKEIKLKFEELEDYFEFLKYLKEEVLSEVALIQTYDNDSARQIQEKMEIYFNALNKEIPKEWFKYYESFTAEKKKIRDPDYILYLKLKNKFEES